jgi:hypothetical protein
MDAPPFVLLGARGSPRLDIDLVYDVKTSCRVGGLKLAAAPSCLRAIRGR